MKIASLVSAFLLLIASYVEAKVLIITHSYNRPEFIDMQHRTFQKFLQDDYEFVIFNDATTEEFHQAIQNTCQRLDLRCIDIPQEIHARPYLPRASSAEFHSPSVRCANVIQYSLDVLGYDHDDIVVLIDSDMFLIRDFSFINYLAGAPLAIIPQQRQHVYYLSNILVILNMPLLEDKRDLRFNCGAVEGVGVDVGGESYFYFKSHQKYHFFKNNINLTDLTPEAIELLARTGTAVFPTYKNTELSECNMKYIWPEHIGTWKAMTKEQEQYDTLRYLFELNPSNIDFFIDHSFLHYGSGSNWNNMSNEYHQNKTETFRLFLEKLYQR